MVIQVKYPSSEIFETGNISYAGVFFVGGGVRVLHILPVEHP
jgi:hypothetical protein